MGAHESVFVVEFGTGQEVQAGGVHEDRCAACLDDKVVRILIRRQVEFVLEAGAAASQHFNAEGFGSRVRRQDFGHAGGGGSGKAELVEGLAHGQHIVCSGLGGKGGDGLRDHFKSRSGGRLDAIFCAPVLTYFKYAPLRCSEITPSRLTRAAFKTVS
jgi:hypothetical protein